VSCDIGCGGHRAEARATHGPPRWAGGFGRACIPGAIGQAYFPCDQRGNRWRRLPVFPVTKPSCGIV
jgi:hypothetical protein